MDNVFDAQDFGGSVHGVLLVVGGFVHQKGLGVEKNWLKGGGDCDSKLMMACHVITRLYDVVEQD